MATDPKNRKKPPRMPGAAVTVPPMPVPPSTSQPPRRDTIEVKIEWLEVVDDAKKKKDEKK
jgi:hypothetical protein